MLPPVLTVLRLSRRFIAVLFLLAAVCDAKPFGIGKDGKLDKSAIAAGYMESEWDQVVASLEGYLRRKGDNQVPVEERIFAYKYLGVISAADTLTRAKAESYFTRMFRLSPDIDIVDLFPSSRVLEIFKNAKSEYERFVRYSTQHDDVGRKTAAVDTAKSPNPGAAPSKSAPVKGRTPKQEKLAGTRKHSWIWWTFGIATAAGVGAGAYYLATLDLQEKPLVTESNDVVQQ